MSLLLHLEVNHLNQRDKHKMPKDAGAGDRRARMLLRREERKELLLF